jgi:hypothetical protein
MWRRSEWHLWAGEEQELDRSSMQGSGIEAFS